MLYYNHGGTAENIDTNGLKEGLFTALDKIGPRKKVLVIPPDITRLHSRAGDLTRYAREYYGDRLTDIMPALGTHTPMTLSEITQMFGPIPPELFREHKWRTDLYTLGRVPADYIAEVTEGKLDYDWPAQVNSLLLDGGYDLILSIGQVVPHEVIGMANYNKNLFVGVGGSEAIHKSHYIGAVCGMENIMGRIDTPVRKVLNYASDNFGKELPVVYVHTVVSKNTEGNLATRGLFIGDDISCFEKAADLSLKVNFSMLDKPVKKAVVYLDPQEFRSTWLGNKAIYRTRMAMADNSELLIMAPGIKEFGEDPEIDTLIRKYGYTGTSSVLEYTMKNPDLQKNLSAAAHLVHGSSEGRFSITYATGYLTRKEIESVNFSYAGLQDLMHLYDPATLTDGYNTVQGEEIFYISNPALGLWAWKDRFK